MADPENPKSHVLENLEPWTEGLKPGESRCFTNIALQKQESFIRLLQSGVESSWPLNGPCSHALGPYGWVSDVLLSGYAAYRTSTGNLYIYKCSAEAGEIDWKWS